MDYVAGAPDAGIINDTAGYPEITTEVLEPLNEVGAEENLSTGFHAIEFLLWGPDLSAEGSGGRHGLAAGHDRPVRPLSGPALPWRGGRAG